MGPRTDWFTPRPLPVWLRSAGRSRPSPTAWACAWRARCRWTAPSPATAQRRHGPGCPAGAAQRPARAVLADHPLTGGYPVIGCVAPYHLDRAGQIPFAGAWLRFNPIQPFERAGARRKRARNRSSKQSRHPWSRHFSLDMKSPDRQPGRDRRPHRPRLPDYGVQSVAVYANADIDALHTAWPMKPMG